MSTPPPHPPAALVPARPPYPQPRAAQPSALPPQAGSFSARVVTATLIILLMLGLAFLMLYARDLVLLAFAGTLLAVILSWPTDALARSSRLPRTVCLGIVLGTLLIFVLAGGFLLGSRIVDQVQEFQQSLPEAFRSFRDDMRGNGVGQWVIEQTPRIHSYLTSPDLLHRLQGFLSSTFGVFGNLIVVFFVALFLALEPRLYLRGLVSLVPLARRSRAQEVLEHLGRTIRWWSLGQLISMTVVGILTATGLKLLGIPLAATLGTIAGLLNFIPNFGPIIAMIPGILIAFAPRNGTTAVYPNAAFYTFLLYFCVQGFDGYFMTPAIQRRAVALPPALIAIFQFLMLILMGPLGLILSTPLLAVLLVLVRTLYVEDALGDRSPPPSPVLAERLQAEDAAAAAETPPQPVVKATS